RGGRQAARASGRRTGSKSPLPALRPGSLAGRRSPPRPPTDKQQQVMSPRSLPSSLPLWLALIGGLSACPKEETSPLGSDVVALVNGEPLTGEMVLRELSTSEVHAPTQPQLAPLKRAVLDTLV